MRKKITEYFDSFPEQGGIWSEFVPENLPVYVRILANYKVCFAYMI